MILPFSSKTPMPNQSTKISGTPSWLMSPMLSEGRYSLENTASTNVLSYVPSSSLSVGSAISVPTSKMPGYSGAVPPFR